jgi:hypothetical protein
MALRRSLIAALLAASALFVGTVGSVAATEPTTTPVTCDGHWPAVLQGVPSTWKAGAVAGTYIWHDSIGMHLRVTHRGTARLVFAGRIVSDQPMRVQAIRLEGSDFVALSADQKTITYRVSNYGRVDGLNFQTACAGKLTFTLSAGGERLPRWRIFIGHNGAHPLQNPFTITRVN